VKTLKWDQHIQKQEFKMISTCTKETIIILVITFSSQLQLKNVNPLLIYMFQDLSNDILGAQFRPPYYMHFYSKVSRFPLDYNFQNVCHLGLLWTPFFAFFHTCDNVLEFWETLSTCSHFHSLAYVMSPKLGSQHPKTIMKILFPHQWDIILRSSHMKDALTQIKREKTLVICL
jgi:hypothetical protein